MKQAILYIHGKGSLGLEVDHLYAFIGDAIYSKSNADTDIYNVQKRQ